MARHDHMAALCMRGCMCMRLSPAPFLRPPSVLSPPPSLLSHVGQKSPHVYRKDDAGQDAQFAESVAAVQLTGGLPFWHGQADLNQTPAAVCSTAAAPQWPPLLRHGSGRAPLAQRFLATLHCAPGTKRCRGEPAAATGGFQLPSRARRACRGWRFTQHPASRVPCAVRFDWRGRGGSSALRRGPGGSFRKIAVLGFQAVGASDCCSRPQHPRWSLSEKGGHVWEGGKGGFHVRRPDGLIPVYRFAAAIPACVRRARLLSHAQRRRATVPIASRTTVGAYAQCARYQPQLPASERAVRFPAITPAGRRHAQPPAPAPVRARSSPRMGLQQCPQAGWGADANDGALAANRAQLLRHPPHSQPGGGEQQQRQHERLQHHLPSPTYPPEASAEGATHRVDMPVASSRAYDATQQPQPQPQQQQQQQQQQPSQLPPPPPQSPMQPPQPQPQAQPPQTQTQLQPPQTPQMPPPSPPPPPQQQQQHQQQQQQQQQEQQQQEQQQRLCRTASAGDLCGSPPRADRLRVGSGREAPYPSDRLPARASAGDAAAAAKAAAVAAAAVTAAAAAAAAARASAAASRPLCTVSCPSRAVADAWASVRPAAQTHARAPHELARGGVKAYPSAASCASAGSAAAPHVSVPPRRTHRRSSSLSCNMALPPLPEDFCAELRLSSPHGNSAYTMLVEGHDFQDMQHEFAAKTSTAQVRGTPHRFSGKSAGRDMQGWSQWQPIKPLASLCACRGLKIDGEMRDRPLFSGGATSRRRERLRGKALLADIAAGGYALRADLAARGHALSADIAARGQALHADVIAKAADELSHRPCGCTFPRQVPASTPGLLRAC
eukprot:349634-Chlamydomonas_euryale.AAC.13